jgi:beta-N-acetylhexosaminidase
MLWQEMSRHSENISVVAVNEKMTEDDKNAVRKRLNEAELVVCTSYYNYRSHANMIPCLEELRTAGKQMIVLSNTPYSQFGVPDWVDAALISFCPGGREHMCAAADILFGKQPATAKLPVNEL